MKKEQNLERILERRTNIYIYTSNMFMYVSDRYAIKYFVIFIFKCAGLIRLHVFNYYLNFYLRCFQSKIKKSVLTFVKNHLK